MTIVLMSESTFTLPVVARELGGEFLRKRFACISTAAAVYAERGWVRDEQACLVKLGATVTEVELSKLAPEAALEMLEDSEGIFVHGGNTFFLLQEMQRVGFAEFVEKYIAFGRPYLGSSAGSIVAGPRIDLIAATDDPSKAPSVTARGGLGLVNFTPMVHFDVQSYWPAFRDSFNRAIETGSTVVPLRNDQFVVVQGDSFRIVTADGPRNARP